MKITLSKALGLTRKAKLIRLAAVFVLTIVILIFAVGKGDVKNLLAAWRINIDELIFVRPPLNFVTCYDIDDKEVSNCSDSSVVTAIIEKSDKFYVNYKGDLMMMPGTPQNFDSFNLEDKDIIVDGSTTKVTFAGPLRLTDAQKDELEELNVTIGLEACNSGTEGFDQETCDLLRRRIIDESLDVQEVCVVGSSVYDATSCEAARTKKEKYDRYSYDAISIKSLTVSNGATITHMGPNTDDNKSSAEDKKNIAPSLELECMGLISEGWIKPTENRSNLTVEANASVEARWAVGDNELVKNSTIDTKVTLASSITKDTIYHFKIKYASCSEDKKSIVFKYDSSQMPATEFYSDSSASTGNESKILSQYFKPKISEIQGTELDYRFQDGGDVFNSHLKLTPQITETAYGGDNYFNNSRLSNIDIGSNGESRRMLSLNVPEDLNLVSGGKIDVSGKGMRGGNYSSLCDGNSDYTNNDNTNGGGKGIEFGDSNDPKVAGGGAYVGQGGCGKYSGDTADLRCALRGIKIASSEDYDISEDNLPDLLGSGGGLTRNNTSTANVSSGGGAVNLKVGDTLFLDTKTSGAGIYANGDNSKEEDNSSYYSGAGSGGTIGIVADKISMYPDNTSPSVSAGASSLNETSYKAEDGVFEPFSANTEYSQLSNRFQAKGGAGVPSAGHNSIEGYGAGGGGRIVIDYDNFVPDCHITSGTSIPAICENQDVVVEGTSTSPLTINANAVQIDQDSSSRSECTDANDTTCDTKRKFKSLTLKYATITHDGINITDNSYVSRQTTGTERWKKVDFEVEDEIVLDIGGKIDVSGKGYPGGSGGSNSTDSTNGGGPGGGIRVSNTSSCSSTSTCASGGGNFSTMGGKGSSTQNQITYTNYSKSDGTYELEAGSGGGGIKKSTTYKSGGAGGGRVKLFSGVGIKFIDSSASYIKAEGSLGVGSSPIYSGGGAGGSIWLEAPYMEFNFDSGETTCSNYSCVVGGLGGTTGAFFPSDGFNSQTANVSAKGANGGYAVNGSSINNGGAGGIINIVFLNIKDSIKIKKTLSAVLGVNGDTDFNPYALREGDKITVNVEVSGYETGRELRIEDNVLLGGNKICKPGENIIDGMYDEFNKKVVFTKSNPTSPPTNFSYTCIIQKL